jgi:hypothetical protein
MTFHYQEHAHYYKFICQKLQTGHPNPQFTVNSLFQIFTLNRCSRLSHPQQHEHSGRFACFNEKHNSFTSWSIFSDKDCTASKFLPKWSKTLNYNKQMVKQRKHLQLKETKIYVLWVKQACFTLHMDVNGTITIQCSSFGNMMIQCAEN